jgi:hypothetical protein
MVGGNGHSLGFDALRIRALVWVVSMPPGLALEGSSGLTQRFACTREDHKITPADEFTLLHIHVIIAFVGRHQPSPWGPGDGLGLAPSINELVD